MFVQCLYNVCFKKLDKRCINIPVSNPLKHPFICPYTHPGSQTILHPKLNTYTTKLLLKSWTQAQGINGQSYLNDLRCEPNFHEINLQLHTCLETKLQLTTIETALTKAQTYQHKSLFYVLASGGLCSLNYNTIHRP